MLTLGRAAVPRDALMVCDARLPGVSLNETKGRLTYNRFSGYVCVSRQICEAACVETSQYYYGLQQGNE